MTERSRQTRILVTIAAVAFLLRVAFGFVHLFIGGEGQGISSRGWWDSGYSFNGVIAINFVEGRGLGFVERDVGEIRARRPPLFPILLALEYLLFGRSNAAPILIHSLIGTMTVLVTYMIGKILFGPLGGYLSASMVAVYPYYVSHDTALQDTALFALLTALAVYFLLRTAAHGRFFDFTLSGLFLGLASLAKEPILGVIPFIVLWLCLNFWRQWRFLAKGVSLMLLSFMTVISPWLIRNMQIYGRPLFTAGFGFLLWQGNNPYTLTYYPRESLDRSTEVAMAALSDEEKRALRNIGELGKDRWFRKKAWEFIRENPTTVLMYALVKAGSALGPRIVPWGKSRIREFMYTVSYFPAFLLALAGAVLSRKRWRRLSIFYFLFLAFLGGAMVVFAHTSNRVYLDVYLLVLAAYGAMRILGLAEAEGGETAGRAGFRGIGSRAGRFC